MKYLIFFLLLSPSVFAQRDSSFFVSGAETPTGPSFKWIVPTSVLAGASYYISAKTTTTFDVTYLTAITGAVNLDWTLFK